MNIYVTMLFMKFSPKCGNWEYYSIFLEDFDHFKMFPYRTFLCYVNLRVRTGLKTKFALKSMSFIVYVKFSFFSKSLGFYMIKILWKVRQDRNEKLLITNMSLLCFYF